MKKVGFLFVIILFFAVPLTGCDFGKSAVDYSIDMTPRMVTLSQANAEDVVSAVSVASVAIRATSTKTEAIGSGVAVASGGYVLTNNHVIEGAKNLTLYLANNDTTSASVIWRDADQDLAILKAGVDLPYVEMSASTNLKKGQDILAIGTPLSLQFEQTVTKGIVSALNRTVEIENSNGTTSYVQNLIQHDASINPGNSGGPLFNLRGQLVGINTLKASQAEGLGFAIPIEICVPVLNKITKGLSFETPYLGLFGFDATTAKYYNKTTQKDGVYVMNVSEKGPCFKAGIKIGDVITKINGKAISTLLDMRVELYNFQSGDVIEFEIDRDSNIFVTQVTLQ